MSKYILFYELTCYHIKRSQIINLVQKNNVAYITLSYA